jgi:hypothetical protein
MTSTIIVEDDLHDNAWNHQARSETPTQRLDRNWADLLQELRVLQTGVQLLTGFLLILPFQSRFDQLSTFQCAVYLLTVSLAVAATGCLIAPVSLHRILFRRHARAVLVMKSHRLAVIGMLLLACAVIGAVMLVFDVVAGTVASLLVAAVTATALTFLWVVMPFRARAGADEPASHRVRSS